MILKRWLRDTWGWLTFKIGSIVNPSYRCRGVLIRFFFLEEREQAAARERLDAALGLIETTHPVQMRKVRRHLSSIAVLPAGISQYQPIFLSCLLPIITVTDTPTMRLAMIIVHEACHGRLYDEGIRGYPDSCRERIEQICVSQEVSLARRFDDKADGEHWAAYALSTLQSKGWEKDVIARRQAEEIQKIRSRF